MYRTPVIPFIKTTKTKRYPISTPNAWPQNDVHWQMDGNAAEIHLAGIAALAKIDAQKTLHGHDPWSLPVQPCVLVDCCSLAVPITAM